jgi:formate dehydrogenase alpha subunit
VAGLATAFGSGAMTNSVEEIEDAETILIIGSNTTATHPLVAWRIFTAKEKGAKIVVIDPRRTHIARFADLYLAEKPGTDVAVINGLMHIIIKEGWVDEGFIRSRTEGFEALKALVAEYTPERVQEISGIPGEQLRLAAEMYAKTKASSIIYCMGITQHTVGVDNVLALADLAMITGQIGKPSSGVNPLRGQNNVQGSTDMGAIPTALPGYQSVADDAAVAKFEKAWGVTLPRKPGLTLMEMMDAMASGTMKALYIMGENPMVSDPDVGHVKHALEKLDLLVVQDIFPTETTELAHVVLPAVTFAEKDGTFVSTDRRIQRVRKAVEPLGDARPDWQIICDVAKALGAAGFDYASPKEIFDEIASLVPLYAGVDYERIRENGIQWPCRTKDDPGAGFLHKGTFSKGLGTLKPIAFKAPAELPDAEFPLTLMTGRDAFHYHTGTMTRRSKRLTNQINSCYVQINPDDARSLGIRNGDMARIESRRGAIEAEARVTKIVPKGSVFVPFHFAEAAANVLTNPALDPVVKIPEYKVCAVRIQKAA